MNVKFSLLLVFLGFEKVCCSLISVKFLCKNSLWSEEVSFQSISFSEISFPGFLGCVATWGPSMTTSHRPSVWRERGDHTEAELASKPTPTSKGSTRWQKNMT